MKHGYITIHFDHYWHCGTGQAGEGDVDLLPVTERCGLPFVPGRALRGRLKWAARELGWDDTNIERLFGRTDSRNLDAFGKLHVTDGIMRDAFAASCRQYFERNQKQRTEVPSLFEDIASTSIEKGVARKSSLRRVRYALPVTLIAEIDLEGDTLWKDVDTLVAAFRAIGKGKHDGFGWCSASLVEVTRSTIGASPGDAVAYDLELTLLDDIALSATSATEGGHRTLDHIPGSALMGAAARALFAKLKERGGALALAKAKVSFGNGAPISPAGAETVPMPLSWHHAKDAPGIKADALQPANIHNLASVAIKQSGLNEKQRTQMREGWLDASTGTLAPVPRTQTLKTAISAKLDDYERAETSALFGYEAIEAGTRFRARIEILEEKTGKQHSLHANLCQVVREAFAGKTIRLGRSKGTEFGRARCALTSAKPCATPSVTGTANLLAQSDLALVDASGFPTLEPEPLHFGLNGWRLDKDRTYLCFRRYSLWNAKRGGRDLERQVICKGSVIVFTGPPGVTAVPKARVGLGQAEGLGRLLVQPAFLQDETPAFEKTAPALGTTFAPAGETAVLDTDDLTAWVEDRHNEKQFDTLAAQLARQWCDAWRRARGKVSPSQWGRLDEAARDVQTVAELQARLGAPGDEDANTIFGHGKWAKQKSSELALARAVRASLDGAEANRDRLTLAAFRDAVHRMAAQTRVQRDKPRHA